VLVVLHSNLQKAVMVMKQFAPIKQRIRKTFDEPENVLLVNNVLEVGNFGDTAYSG